MSIRHVPPPDLAIRLAASADADALWAILEPVIRAGETYALDPAMTRDAVLASWCGADRQTFVSTHNDEIAGIYYLRANQPGGGAHVANCGYVTSSRHQGRGIARAMCLHSLAQARARGFRAMQFNLVVSTNDRAVNLWRDLGFEIAGRLPGAFHHPRFGFVDAFVMFRDL